MDIGDAEALIAGAIPAATGVEPMTARWADLGAGQGTFTLALARLLGPGAQLYAVDRESVAVAALGRLAARPRGEAAATILPRRADFASAEEWDALGLPPLDGVLLANALHFVAAADQGDLLARLTAALRPVGRLVVVEYEGRRPSRWVPFPVSIERLRAILPASVGPPRQVGRLPSAFGGWIYAAVAECGPGQAMISNQEAP
jgi:SAM-dependent methyltransferase